MVKHGEIPLGGNDIFAERTIIEYIEQMRDGEQHKCQKNTGTFTICESCGCYTFTASS